MTRLRLCTVTLVAASALVATASLPAAPPPPAGTVETLILYDHFSPLGPETPRI